MPDQEKTPRRTVRVDDELWHAAQQQAAERGETLSDAIREFLRIYVRG